MLNLFQHPVPLKVRKTKAQVSIQLYSGRNPVMLFVFAFIGFYQLLSAVQIFAFAFAFVFISNFSFLISHL